MSNYVICIPSYKRAQICNDKTLTTLHKDGIPAKQVYVYVANQEEYDEYKKVLDPALYGKIVLGKPGLRNQRQFIKEDWPENKCIVSCDDDLGKIDMSLSKQFKGESLDHFIKYAFAECKRQKAFLWGIYPVYNPFFRKARSEMSTCLNFIVGCFYGFINRPKLKAINADLSKIDCKMDVELTLKYFIHDGIVLRFNRIGFLTKYFGTSGGIGNFEQRLEPMRIVAGLLKKKYPEYGEISTRKNGMTEFNLKKIPARVDESKSEKNKTIKTKVINRKTRKIR